MKYILIVLAIIAAYVAFYVIHIYFFTHHSPNPVIVQHDRIFPAKDNSPTQINYIAAGDSTAVGIGASSVEKTYPYQIAEALSKKGNVSYRNVGVSGARTMDIINSQLSQIIESNPDVITISIGANDATHLLPKESILKNYQRIISELTAKTHAQIYITNIANFTGAELLPYPFIKLIETRSKDLNVEILKLTTDRVHIINIHDFGWGNYPNRRVTYSLDHFHPSDTGYENWAHAFLNSIP